MTRRRPPYYPYQYYQDQPYFPPFVYQQQEIPPGTPPMNAPVAPPYEHFAKPLQPSHWEGYYAVPPQQGANPNWGPPQQPNFMAYFQDKDGQLDLDKMLSTVGQMANTVQQVSPVFKGLGSFIKGIK